MIYAKSAFSAAAMTLLMGSASFAQGAGPIAGERVDVQGMPTTHSTPAEQAETARINNQVGADNAAIDAKAAAADAKAASDNSQYQAQQRQYQGQLQQNQAQQQDYQDRTIAYNKLRERYAAERATYRRGVWPNRYVKWVIVERDAGLIGERAAGERDRLGRGDVLAHELADTVVDRRRRQQVDRQDRREDEDQDGRGDGGAGCVVSGESRQDRRALGEHQ